jgi:hypothetical protein
MPCALENTAPTELFDATVTVAAPPEPLPLELPAVDEVGAGVAEPDEQPAAAARAAKAPTATNLWAPDIRGSRGSARNVIDESLPFPSSVWGDTVEPGKVFTAWMSAAGGALPRHRPHLGECHNAPGGTG